MHVPVDIKDSRAANLVVGEARAGPAIHMEGMKTRIFQYTLIAASIVTGATTTVFNGQSILALLLLAPVVAIEVRRRQHATR